jgi:predicted component of type VI protein secretion system
MKKEIFYLLMIIVTGILLSGCSKSKDEPQPEPESQLSMEILLK